MATSVDPTYGASSFMENAVTIPERAFNCSIAELKALKTPLKETRNELV
jgi:hypothetical protein